MPSTLVGKCVNSAMPLFPMAKHEERYHYALSFNSIRPGALIFLMVFRNSNHRGRKSWLPTIEPSKTKSVLANRNQGQTSADRVPEDAPGNSFENLDLGVKGR
jgi:hypothetical protein